VKSNIFPAEIIRENVNDFGFRGLGCMHGTTVELRYGERSMICAISSRSALRLMSSEISIVPR
jgi:hypothetical protein